MCRSTYVVSPRAERSVRHSLASGPGGLPFYSHHAFRDMVSSSIADVSARTCVAQMQRAATAYLRRLTICLRTIVSAMPVAWAALVTARVDVTCGAFYSADPVVDMHRDVAVSNHSFALNPLLKQSSPV